MLIIQLLQVSSGWKIATYISGIIIIALLAFNFVNRRNLNSDILRLDKSIAVLPFLNESPVDSNKYFINGIMEEVLTNLQKIKDFRVLSRTSTDQYKEQDRPTIPEIAKKLNVNYVVEGSGQKYGNTFILRVQLIKGKGKETHLWAKSFEQEIKEVKDYIKIQSQIAQAIAAELKAVITPEEIQLIEKISTANLTAYDFYQKGREEEGNFSYYDITTSSTLSNLYNPSAKQSIERAEKMYKTAFQYDSTFALAYTGLAGIYWSKNYYKDYFSENFLDSVLLLANKALYFDNQLPDAYYIRGMYYKEKGNNKEALENFDKTLKLNPNYWLAYFGKGDLYFHDNDFVMAIKYFQEAELYIHGSGLSDVLKRIYLMLYFSGFNELASNYVNEVVKLESDSCSYYFWKSMFEGNSQKRLEFLQKGYSIDSTNTLILEYLTDYYWGIGQYKEGLRFYKNYSNRLKEQGVLRVNTMQHVGYIFSNMGLKDSADYYFNKQIKYSNDAIRLGRTYNNWAYYDLAKVYAFMGNKIKAYENLENFSKSPRMPKWFADNLKTDDPLFYSIRNEPEFQKIVRDVEAKYQAEHERVRKWLEETGQL